jgi:hypothetical protein
MEDVAAALESFSPELRARITEFQARGYRFDGQVVVEAALMSGDDGTIFLREPAVEEQLVDTWAALMDNRLVVSGNARGSQTDEPSVRLIMSADSFAHGDFSEDISPQSSILSVEQLIAADAELRSRLAGFGVELPAEVEPTSDAETRERAAQFLRRTMPGVGGDVIVVSAVSMGLFALRQWLKHRRLGGILIDARSDREISVIELRQLERGQVLVVRDDGTEMLSGSDRKSEKRQTDADDLLGKLSEILLDHLSDQ